MSMRELSIATEHARWITFRKLCVGSQYWVPDLQSEVNKKRVETSVLAINVLKSRAYIPELLFVRVCGLTQCNVQLGSGTTHSTYVHVMCAEWFPKHLDAELVHDVVMVRPSLQLFSRGWLGLVSIFSTLLDICVRPRDFLCSGYE